MSAIAATRSADARVRTRLLSPSQGLPLVVEPGNAVDADATGTHLASLIDWLTGERDHVAGLLRTHGALLFRGFDVREPQAFEQVARCIAPALKNDYLGTSPRDALTDYVFSASELPPWYPIPQHCEMSFTKSPPSHLFFHCMVEPRGPGGETPLADFRAVLRDLDPAVRERFERKGIRIIRNYSGPEGGGHFDLWKLKRWDEMFRTTNRDEVERICAEQGFEPTWLPGGRLRLVSHQSAIQQHPKTGEAVWFNHSQVFHPSSAEGELRRIARRQRPIRNGGLSLVAKTLMGMQRRTRAPEEAAMTCAFGDGSPIPDADMEKVRDAIWKNLVVQRWQAGDVVAIDNLSVSHGRMPYSGPRLITVCWA